MKKAVKYILAGVAIAGAGVVVADRIVAHCRKKKRQEERMSRVYEGKHFKDENCTCDECLSEDVFANFCDEPKEDKYTRRDRFKACIEKQKERKEQTEAQIHESTQEQVINEEIPDIDLSALKIDKNQDITQ